MRTFLHLQLLTAVSATTAGDGSPGGTTDLRGTDTEATAYGAAEKTQNKLSTLTAPATQNTALSYDTNKVKGSDTNTVDSTNGDTSIDDTNLGQDGCDGSGFMCDFSEIAKMSKNNINYLPEDFVWRVVNPNERYDTDQKLATTLNCEVEISAQPNNNVFYVPMGMHNDVASSNYCDIEAVRRDFADAELYMNDTIHIRGETARLTNTDASAFDLIGEQFDLICGCKTSLSTEASLKTQSSTTMQYVMASTGTTREMTVTLKLFSKNTLESDSLVDTGSLQPFPDDEAAFFFLAHHTKANDWDARLQINTCIACDSGSTCSTDEITAADELIFYENCDVIEGGPQRFAVDQTTSTWMAGSTAVPGTDIPSHVGGKWAPSKVATESDSTVEDSLCPYAAIGVAKFRLQGSETMKITCQVTACSKRPCVPCTTRRSLGVRQLQGDSGNNVDVSMFMNVPGSNTAVLGGDDNSSSAKKRGAFFIALICVIALCVAAGIYIATRQAKKRNEATKARTVELGSKAQEA